MRKLIVWNLITLDGYFEGAKPWDIDFHSLVWGPEFEALGHEQEKEADLLVFGRKTYEGMASYWKTAENEGSTTAFMNETPKLVASRTLTTADWTNSRVTADPVAELTKLKRQPGGTIFIFGSAELADGMLKAGLVDEYRLGLVPVLLGQGNRHFKTDNQQRKLTLLDSKPTAKGAVILRYAVAR